MYYKSIQVDYAIPLPAKKLLSVHSKSSFAFQLAYKSELPVSHNNKEIT